MKKKVTKLALERETLRVLREASLSRVAAGAGGPSEVVNNGCTDPTKLLKVGGVG